MYYNDHYLVQDRQGPVVGLWSSGKTRPSENGHFFTKVFTRMTIFQSKTGRDWLSVSAVQKITGRPKMDISLLKCLLQWPFFNPRQAGTRFSVSDIQKKSGRPKTVISLLKCLLQCSFFNPRQAGTGCRSLEFRKNQAVAKRSFLY